MKQKLFVFLIIALLSVSAAVAGPHGSRGQKGSFGSCGDGGQGMGNRAGMILQLADKLELSDSQNAEVKNLMEKNGLDRIERKAEMQKAQLKLRHLKINEASDKEILSAIDRAGNLKTDMKKARFQHQSQMKSILTTEQSDKLKELKKEFGQGRGFQGKNHPGKAPRNDNNHRSHKCGSNAPRNQNCWGN